MGNAAQVSRELKYASTQVTKDLVLNLLEELVAATPIKTGWASVNWIAEIDEPRSSPVGSRLAISSTEQENGIAMVASGFTFGRTLFISNNVPYIVDLNNGSSPQARAGFVQTSIARSLSKYADVEIS